MTNSQQKPKRNITREDKKMSKETPYIEIYEGMYLTRRIPLYPTGRWKLKSGPWYKDKMFIEHKGWLFKKWISEDSIVFAPTESKEIFNCREQKP